MKRLASGIWAFALLVSVFAQPAFASDMVSTLPGHYYLLDAREVGSELLLSKDGSFKFFISFGGTDLSATGRWRVANNVVRLESMYSGEEPQFRVFSEKQNAALVDEVSTRENLCIAVIGDSDGRALAGIDVKFKWTNGRMANAVTNFDGKAAAFTYDAERWESVGLRREHSREDYQWLTLPAQGASTRVAGFLTSNTAPVVIPVFDKLNLKIIRGQLKVQKTKDDLVKGTYAKK
jgi:hypothetical protein